MTTTMLSSGRSRTVALTVVTALVPMVWGTTYFVTTEMLPAGYPLFAGLVRALPAGLVAIAVGALLGMVTRQVRAGNGGTTPTRALPRGSWWWKSAVLGILNIGLFFPLLFLTAERLPGGVAATFGAITPVVVALLALPVLGEPLSVHKLVWGGAGVVGVGLVVLGPEARLDAVGVAAGLGGAVSMALGVALTKRWGRPDGVGPIASAGWQLTAGGIFLLPITLLTEGPPPAVDGTAVLGYLWLGLVGGLIAYVLWFRGIGRLPVTSVAFLGPLAPLVAAGIGVGVLGETLTPVQVAGLVLALAAVLAGQLPPRGRRVAPPAAVAEVAR
ncbi:putative blue pigment (indigoidine) exporter [Promicromonospora umidemergens]|uniref:EamA family transporter n=1 Tax=Promicromonospora umidemergens TaxID=629679 RepID=A0ABP8XAR2_9MICO|nr:EamA family transporter [Promicromonospora umidemergens]MCP2281573.1 putative blue pigment (indigoidine) exporter [Promicromonospora umidemergens]